MNSLVLSIAPCGEYGPPIATTTSEFTSMGVDAIYEAACADCPSPNFVVPSGVRAESASAEAVLGALAR